MLHTVTVSNYLLFFLSVHFNDSMSEVQSEDDADVDVYEGLLGRISLAIFEDQSIFGGRLQLYPKVEDVISDLKQE